MDAVKRIDETTLLPDRWRASAPIAVGAGLLMVVAGCLTLYLIPAGNIKGHDATPLGITGHSYLANFMFIFSFAVGGLFHTVVSFLTRAGWNASIRRVAEILGASFPYISLLFIPVLLTLINDGTAIYAWNGEDLNDLVSKKTGYLNWQFFVLRSILYVVLLSAIGLYYYRLSLQQDRTTDVEPTLKRQYWSGPMIMVFALTVSFVSWDWIMSIDPDWYSTIFGVYYFAASMFGLFAFMIGACLCLQKAGKLRNYVTVEHYHDMGKFLFGFVMFWTYIAFSQLLLYWYANIPEETVWYRYRWEYGWAPFSLFLLATHFAIPLLGLLSRHVRRRPWAMGFWAVWAIFVHWLDMTFLVMPNIAHFSLVMMVGHLICGIGMFAVLVGIVLWRASGVSLVATGDPRLHEALAYTNPIL